MKNNKNYTNSNLRVRWYLLVFLTSLKALIVLGQQPDAIINARVHGKVVDTRNEPVIGATIQINGTTHGVTTELDGSFYFQTGQKLPFAVTIRSLGFLTKELLIEHDDFTIVLDDDVAILNEIVVTARRRRESVQEIPIPITVIAGALVEEGGAFNVNRLKEYVPTVQLYSSNPRNTTLNIRGLGSTFGLTNDGIDPGVGFYVDGVYYARPAATSLDFIDVEQVEVLRGPQGTLFGKNTTAGALNITTRPASFKPSAKFELSYGNYGFIQAKTALTGPLSKKFAGKFAFSGTQRNGTIYHATRGKYLNDLNNLGLKGQLLFKPNQNVQLKLSVDATEQKPDGYAQVIAGVVQTKRAAYRQFNQIIGDLGYRLPSTDPFDRIIDHDSPWRSNNALGGVTVNGDFKLGSGTLTSTSAWRYWNWDPSNDRDFTGLPVLTKSAATSTHDQWSQELRYAGDLTNQVNGVFGIFALKQRLVTDPVHTEESGAAQWRFSQNSASELWKTPGLFEGYGIKTNSSLNTLSAAVYGQFDWALTTKLRILPGIRYNFDQKEVSFDRQTYGGLQTTDPALLALKRTVYTDQNFQVNVEESNLSGQLTAAYDFSTKFNAFATVANSYKPIGVNLGGLPTASGKVLLDLAKIAPEQVYHFEIGIKSSPGKTSVLNLTYFNTTINDYQTQVQTAEIGVNRGYLANAEKVRVTGLELDGNISLGELFKLNTSITYTDGIYALFTNAPVPLEETGSEKSFKDISGDRLPGISKWAGTLNAELSWPVSIYQQKGKFFIALDNYYRSAFSSSPSPSQFLNIDSYVLTNARLGYRAHKGLSFFLWSRNMFNHNYFEQLLPAAGNAGHYAAVLGDPRTYGITLSYFLD